VRYCLGIAINPWIQRLATAPPPATRLFCLPHAGGAAGFFRPMAAALAGRVEVLGVQYPGRQNRFVEPVLTSIVELADRIAEALQPWLDAPFALFGHSMGAWLGYEVVRRLERAGHSPVRLFASGIGAPALVPRGRGYELDGAELAAKLRELGGTEQEIVDSPDLLELIVPAFRGDMTAVYTYRADPGAVLRCPVTALIGDDDVTATVDDMRAWAGYTSGPHEVVVFAGGHFYLTDQCDAVVRTVVERLNLERV
jgi:surfactin synthase thioesterase subunit